MAEYSANKERELIAKVSQGDTDAFKKIFDHYKDRIYAYSLNLAKSTYLAEEATQEIFMKIWSNRESLDATRSFKSYLYQVTKNHIFNLLRSARYDQQLKQQLLSLSARVDIRTEESYMYADLLDFAEIAMNQLPTQRQKIFRMSRIDGLGHDEIASQLGISKNTVKDQIVKAGKSMKKYFQLHADTTFIILIHLLPLIS